MRSVLNGDDKEMYEIANHQLSMRSDFELRPIKKS